MATDNNYYEIDLDIWKQYPVKNVTVKQLDTGRKIRVSLYSNGYKYDITNSKVTVYIKKDNKNIVFNNCKIINTNIIEIEVTSSMVETAGRYNAEVDIISDGNSTFNFIFEVIETNKDTISITQTSEYKALVELFKEMSNIDKKFVEVSTEINNFNNQLEAITANVTNGNESATNSEIVLARQGNISLGVNLSKMKDNINKALSNIFTKEIIEADINDFNGEGVVSISNNTLSVTGETNQYSYVVCDSDVLEFTLENTKYVVLGVNGNTFTTLNLVTVGGTLGRIIDWSSDSYTARAEGLITETFVAGDKVKIEIIETGYNIYRNDSLVLELNKNDYSEVEGWNNSKLGFFVVKDSGNNLAKNVKILKYNVSRIDKIDVIETVLAELENKIEDISNNIYFNNVTYEEKDVDISDFEKSYNGTISIENNVLSSTAPTNNYNYLILKTNRIKFNIKNANYVVLGKNGDNFTTICLKNSNSQYIGALTDITNQSIAIKYTLDISSCSEEDEIIITLENGKYTFEKNGAAWFVIDKNNYANVTHWQEEYLGLFVTPSMYESLVSNLKYNIEVIEKKGIKTVLTELENKVSGINTSKFAGKTAGFLGDSLTKGYGLSDPTKAWEYILKDILGFESIENYGWSGSTISNSSEVDSIGSFVTRAKENIEKIKLLNYFFIFGITNDYGAYPTEIGNETDTSENTVYGALNVLIRELLENCPNTKFYFLTPIKRAKTKGDTTEFDDTPNSLGYTLNDYRKAIINRCEYYSIKYIDTYVISGLNPRIESNRSENFIDGDFIHLNPNGHEVLAYSVAEEV